jgi:hypothetical protein
MFKRLNFLRFLRFLRDIFVFVLVFVRKLDLSQTYVRVTLDLLSRCLSLEITMQKYGGGIAVYE